MQGLLASSSLAVVNGALGVSGVNERHSSYVSVQAPWYADAIDECHRSSAQPSLRASR